MSEKSQYGQTVTYDVVQVLHEFLTPYSHVQYVKTRYHGTMLIMDKEVQYSTLDEHRYHYLLTQPLLRDVLLAVLPGRQTQRHAVLHSCPSNGQYAPAHSKAQES